MILALTDTPAQTLHNSTTIPLTVSSGSTTTTPAVATAKATVTPPLQPQPQPPTPQQPPRQRITRTTVTVKTGKRWVLVEDGYRLLAIPLLPLKPLPEKPTFQELMMYDFYHTNNNSKKSSSYSKSNKRSSRGRHNNDDDLESELTFDLLQPSSPSPPSLLPPPCAVYSPR